MKILGFGLAASLLALSLLFAAAHLYTFSLRVKCVQYGVASGAECRARIPHRW